MSKQPGRHANGANQASQKAVKLAIATYKSASSSIQLQKAAKDLSAVLEGLALPSTGDNRKSTTGLFIEAFNAAYESLEGASRDQGRLRAALRTSRVALSGLKQSRHIIKGRRHEVEIQQYSLIRRLVALKAYEEVRFTLKSCRPCVVM